MNHKFDAVWFAGEDDRLGEWCVVECEAFTEKGGKFGSTLRKFGYDEMAAVTYANNLNMLEMIMLEMNK